MRLIDADKIQWRREYVSDDNMMMEHVVSKGDVDVMPTIDPVKHGHWIYEPYELNDTREECSVCNYHRILLGGRPKDYTAPNYCPDCGAKMDEEKNNG